MKVGTLLLIVMAASAEFPQLSQDERDRATGALIAGERTFLGSVAGLTDAQWNFQPEAGTCSIGDYAEYVAATEDSLFDTVRKLGSSPSIATKGARTPDEMLQKLMRDGSGKAPANCRDVPHWRDRAALIKHFEESRRRTIDYVKTTQDDLRMRFQSHSVYGTLDGYQWILLMGSETERYAKAINALKNEAGYPR
jgi:hypothetical protein